MADDKKKSLTYLHTAVFFSVFLFFYVIVIPHFYGGHIYIPAILTFDMRFSMIKYKSLIDLFGSEINISALSYMFGFFVSGIGWLIEWKKRLKAEANADKLKSQLGDVKKEKEVYLKQLATLSDKGDSSLAGSNKKKSGGNKKKKTGKKLIISIMMLAFVGALLLYLWSSKNTRNTTTEKNVEKISKNLVTIEEKKSSVFY